MVSQYATGQDADGHGEAESLQAYFNRALSLNSSGDFHYSPLAKVGEVRLVRLLPGGGNVGLRMLLSNYREANAPPYEALSYVWGDPRSSVQVELSGKRFFIGNNLAEALHQIRHAQKERILWIDAICINQNDLEEKSWHIAKMRDIYVSAVQVLVWIGKHSEDSANAMDDLRSIARYYPDGRQDAVRRYYFAEHVGEGKAQIPAIMNLLRRPWWSRMWIVQEVVVSKLVVVQCGDISLPWSAFAVIAGHIATSQQVAQTLVSAGILPRMAVTNHITAFESLRRQWASGSIPDILSLLVKYRRSKATDPRDKIFALLGMIQSSERGVVSSDYTKPAARIYSEFVTGIVARTGRLDILAFNNMHRKVPDLPSWAPDWSCSCHQDNDLPLLYDPETFAMTKDARLQQYSGRSASGSKQAKVAYSDDLKTLTAEGIIFDEVREISEEGRIEKLPPALGLPYEESYALPISRLNHFAEKSFGDNTEIKQRVLLRSMMGNAFLKDEDQYLRVFKRRVEESNDGRLWLYTHLKTDGKATYDTEWQLNTILGRVMRGRRLFLHGPGFMGTGPSCVQPGDKLCILLGAAMPFIVRKRSDWYELIGEACLTHQGIMHGCMADKTYEFADRKDLVTEQIRLR
ncbi:MAG: hypothetical protein Q9165_005000 [Trypethelium subeluteriae]